MDNLPALNQGFLAAVGGYQKHEAIKFQEDGSSIPFSFLRFFSSKANNAVDVKMALGKAIQEGHPYVATKGEFEDVSRARYAVLEEFPYWITTDSTFVPNRAWLEPQPFGRKIGDDKVKEAMLSLVLFFPEEGDAFVALADCKTTKTAFVKDYLKAVERSTTPAGAKALGRVAAAVPPRFRVLGTLKMVPKTGSGFSYALAKGDTDVVTIRELEQLQEWAASVEGQAALESLKKLFDRKVEEIKELADATRD